jgi:hypothetical protein
MGPRARYVLLAFVLAGLAGALLLLRSFRTPCGGLLRRYTAAYDAVKPCRADADCVLDPMAARGPGLCDRARAASSDRSALAEIERSWVAASCPEPGEACPPSAGTRCQAGRCVTELAR